jgi:membrane fusion protein (multidrug efflux system)
VLDNAVLSQVGQRSGRDVPRETGARAIPDRPDLPARPGTHGPAQNAAGAPGGRRGKWLRVLILGLLLVTPLSCGGWYGWHWYNVGRFWIKTDDAYTQADSVTVSAQVGGTIADLFVTDNQRIRRGDVIARIDDRSYHAALDQARADVDMQIKNERSIEAQIGRQQSVIRQMQADIASVRAQLAFAEQQQARYAALSRTGSGTKERAQQADSDLQVQQANLARSEANLLASRRQLDVLTAQREQAAAAIERARAVQEQAEINLGYTTITAPRDGVVGDRAVRVGQLVQPGTRLLTLVPVDEVYVVANYKETQLEFIRKGQTVELAVDGYPHAKIAGRIDSVAPGSGAQFALLPPENATGNFTKIVQRVPVKIVLDPQSPLHDRLRPGLSVVSSVDVKAAERAAPKVAVREEREP